MESGDGILRASEREILPKSSSVEDNEEALKWAALERLPTYQRIRRGILTEEKGQAREINVKDLGFLEKKNLLDSL